MAKQVITIEVEVGQVELINMGMQDGLHDMVPEMMQYWMRNNYGYNMKVTVLQVGPLQQTAAEIQAEIESG